MVIIARHGHFLRTLLRIQIEVVCTKLGYGVKSHSDNKEYLSSLVTITD